MALEKSMRDTLEIYLKAIVGKQAPAYVAKFEAAGPNKAHEAIRAMESRHNMRREDVDRLLGE